MCIDIICPLYNAENHIDNLHKSLLMQEDVNIHDIKYILTECEDETEEKLIALKANFKKIKKEEFSHSLTREKVAFECEADILVFITQDIIIKDKKWLYYLTKDIEEGKCEAAFSRQVCDNNSIEKYTRESNYPDTSYINTKDDLEEKGLKAFFFSDASSAIRRDIFVKLNGYDAKKLPTNEDMYIAYKLITNGYRIKYCAESVVIHSHTFTLKQLYKRYYDTGVFFKENSYLTQYGVTESGFKLATYVFKRAIKEKNVKALIRFIPDMGVRYIAKKRGESQKQKNKQ